MNVPLEQLTPEQHAEVEAGLRAYLVEVSRAPEIHGRPLGAVLACRAVRQRAEALVLPAVELAGAWRRADRLVDECVSACDDEGARAVTGVLGWPGAHNAFALVVGMLDEAGGIPTEQQLELLKDDHFDLIIGEA